MGNIKKKPHLKATQNPVVFNDADNYRPDRAFIF